MKKKKVFCVECIYISDGGVICYYKAPKGYKMEYITKRKIRNSNPLFMHCQENKKGECPFYKNKY